MERKKPQPKTSWSIKAFDMFGSPVAFNINGDENYKTVIGCFWTIVMLISLIAAFWWYFTTFLDPTNVEVTTELLIEDEYPLIDFAATGFFFSISATKYNKLVRIEELNNILQFEATQRILDSKEINGERSNPVEREPTIIPFKPCKSGGKTNIVGGQSIEGKSSLATSDRAWCSFVDSTKNQSMFVKGNEDSDVFAYVRLKILPCDSTSPNCLFYYLTVPSDQEGGTRAQCQRFKNEVALEATQLSSIYYGPDDECDCKLTGDQGTTNWKNRCDKSIELIREAINKQIGKTYFTFNYVEAAVKPENYDKPFAYTMKSTVKLYGSINSTKIANIYFRETKVKTDKGFISENFDVKTSVTFDGVLTDFLDRGEGKSEVEVRPGGGEEKEVPASFMEFTCFSSNNQIVFTRKYSKIVDVFANVGGVAEVVGFIVIFFYAWYNGIMMEKKLLNFGVLNKKDTPSQDTTKYGQLTEKWENSRYFGFWELLKYGMMEKGLGFCFKKDRKYDLYHETKETFEKRTDIINIMKAVADVDTLKDALLEQYQIRLMPYLSNQKHDDDDDVIRMSVKEAMKNLNTEKNIKNIIAEKMDEYLKTHLPGEILAGRTGDLDLGNLPIAGRMELMNVGNSEGKTLTPMLFGNKGSDGKMLKRRRRSSSKGKVKDTLKIQVKEKKKEDSDGLGGLDLSD